MHDIQVRLTGHGRGEVTLDGMKISVTDISVHAAVDEVTQVTMTLLVNKVTWLQPDEPSK